MSDYISRADAICEVLVNDGIDNIVDRINKLPSAETEPMAEEVREALMRLTMCAREDCAICKYKDKCNFDFQYEESTKNMNTILDSLMRSKCEVDVKWIPCSERLPSEDGVYLIQKNWMLYGVPDMDVYHWAEGWNCYRGSDGTVNREYEIEDIIAWMPLPKPWKGADDE